MMDDRSAGISGTCEIASKLPFHVPLLDAFPLVVRLLPLAEPDLDLGDVPAEIHPQRDQRESLLLHAGDQFPDLFPVEQELAVADRVVVVDVSLFERTDVHAREPDFPASHNRVYVPEVGASLPKGLDLRPFEGDSRFARFKNEIIVAGPAVCDNNLDGFVLCGHRVRMRMRTMIRNSAGKCNRNSGGALFQVRCSDPGRIVRWSRIIPGTRDTHRSGQAVAPSPPPRGEIRGHRVRWTIRQDDSYQFICGLQIN